MPAGMDADTHAKEIVAHQSDFGIENWGFIDGDMAPVLRLPHPGACLLIDGTGRSNNKADGVLPNEQFVLNRKVYSDSELAKTHIAVLAGIPLGEHGIGVESADQDFGFSAENPFYIFVCADNDDDLRKYISEVEEAIQTLPKNLIKIAGFLAPRVG